MSAAAETPALPPPPPPPPAAPATATIIGLSISGSLLALSLHHYTRTKPHIYELRALPSTLGGAINLSPPAVRILKSLGVLEAIKEKAFETREIGLFSRARGDRLGVLPFYDRVGEGGEEEVKSLRVERRVLLDVLVRALREAGVRIEFGRRLVGVRDNAGEGKVFACFEDGEEVGGDMLFGCDGIRSVVRSTYIEPERELRYSGMCSAYGFCTVSEATGELEGMEGFGGTAVGVGGRGSVLVSYFGEGRERVYVAAVMEVEAPEVGGEDGWKGRGRMGNEARGQLVERFGGGVFGKLVEGVEEWWFFPVWVLENGGRYWRGRAVLVGDAAHAGPPGGEGASLAMEDAVILARLIGKAEAEGRWGSDGTEWVYQRYDELRRRRVMENYRRATTRWEGAKNNSWLYQRFAEFVLWAFLLVFWVKRGWGFEYDAMSVEL